MRHFIPQPLTITSPHLLTSFSFSPVTVDELSLFFAKLSSPTCSLDYISSHLLKDITLFLFIVQLLSCVQLFATPWTAACQASLSVTISQSLLKLMSIRSVMPYNYLILCCPLLLPSVFPSIRAFSNESALCIRWPKYWSLKDIATAFLFFLSSISDFNSFTGSFFISMQSYYHFFYL